MMQGDLQTSVCKTWTAIYMISVHVPEGYDHSAVKSAMTKYYRTTEFNLLGAK